MILPEAAASPSTPDHLQHTPTLHPTSDVDPTGPATLFMLWDDWITSVLVHHLSSLQLSGKGSPFSF